MGQDADWQRTKTSPCFKTTSQKTHTGGRAGDTQHSVTHLLGNGLAPWPALPDFGYLPQTPWVSTSGYTLAATGMRAVGVRKRRPKRNRTHGSHPQKPIIQSERQNTYMKLLKNNFNYPNLGQAGGTSTLHMVQMAEAPLLSASLGGGCGCAAVTVIYHIKQQICG